MDLSTKLTEASGLRLEDRERLRRLINTLRQHAGKNRLKRRYYEGHVTLGEVNLGLALPRSFYGLEIGCAWGGKAVDVLASHSMFDGFVGSGGEEAALMAQICAGNRLRAEYNKACRDELKYGCVFATLSADTALGCKIRWHTPETAAANWSGEKNRIECGMAVIETAKNIAGAVEPWVVNLYTDTDIVVLRRNAKAPDFWKAEYLPHRMGRPLMEPMAWDATSLKPFGRSRLKESVRRLIQSYVRTIANATIGLEFSTAPQKYMLGVTEQQYDALVSDKFRAYVGALIAGTVNPETGNNPVFGQLPQGTIEPHVQMMRLISTQFSAATGLSVTDVGVVNDANPTSSDAILAQTRSLTLLAEQLNAANGDALYMIALMAQAIAGNKTLDALSEEERAVMAHFKNPAMPSVSMTADAAMKIASARRGFAQTDVFAEMVGFSQADIRRIKAQEARARGLAVLEELTEEEDNADDNLES